MNYVDNLLLHDHYERQVSRRFLQNEVSSDFILLLEELMQNPEAFEADQFDIYSLEEVFTYLKASHEFYLSVWIPKLENTLYQMYQKCGDKWSIRLLSMFLQSYQKELKEHIDQEETVLFSYVDKLINGKPCDGHKDLVLNHFIHTHNDNVVIQIDDLRKDLLTYDSELAGNLLFEVLFNQLTIFQHDLMVHGLIEDHVFIDKMIKFKA